MWFIENGLETNMITDVAFVDVSVVYDTINYQTNILKLCRVTMNYDLVKTVATLPRNRRFFVILHGKSNRWRFRKIVYHKAASWLRYYLTDTNYQPISIDQNTKHFIYANCNRPLQYIRWYLLYLTINYIIYRKDRVQILRHS